MKTKEPTRQVRDTVVEKFKAGFGYKKISQALNISRSAVQVIILKWNEYQTTANLPRPSRPSKLSAQTRRRLVRDAAKRPMITLDELQRSTAEVEDSVHRTTVSRTLHKSGLYGRVARSVRMAKSKSRPNSNRESVERAKTAVHKRSPSNLTELELFCKEEWAKISVSRCAKLMETYPKRLVIAAKGGATKY
ncbi:hypothetical protein NFI96_026008 [Prochilodus magdalenae]|nr:hypothetical protein NFI96_026008 [Prochilodus magdalenae]